MLGMKGVLLERVGSLLSSLSLSLSLSSLSLLGLSSFHTHPLFSLFANDNTSSVYTPRASFLISLSFVHFFYLLPPGHPPSLRFFACLWALFYSTFSTLHIVLFLPNSFFLLHTPWLKERERRETRLLLEGKTRTTTEFPWQGRARTRNSSLV